MKGFIISGILILGLAVACTGNKKPQTDASAPPPPTTPLQDVDRVVGLGTIEPLERLLPLNAEVSGTIRTIKVSLNQSVKKGEVLVELDHTLEDAQIQQTLAKIQTQESAIQGTAETAESQHALVENARITYERNIKLFEGGAVSKEILDNSKFQFESLRKQFESAGSTVQQQKGKLQELKADLQYYQVLKEKKFIKAPTDGKILSLDARLGEYISANTRIGDFAPVGALMVLSEIDELFATSVIKGQTAFIRLEGSTDTLAKGTVIFAADYLKKKSLFSDGAVSLEDRRVREVRVQLAPDAKVLIGLRVECVILTGK